VIIIQRVRVRWTAAGREARHANARRDLDSPVMRCSAAGRRGGGSWGAGRRGSDDRSRTNW